jgi:hypothetical protein
VPVSGAIVQFGSDSLSGGTRATTDANGSYEISLPNAGPFFDVSVNGAGAGVTRTTRPRYRGDLLIDRGTCISRYGTISDAHSMVPIIGATVTLGGKSTTSGIDGWYRIDLGCPETGFIGFNTTFIYVTHPNYTRNQVVVGRGLHAVYRLDMGLERP